MPLPERLLNVRPSIRKGIDVKLETICQYNEGIKAALRIKHLGNTVFSDLTVNVSPESSIWAGKSVIQRNRFAFDDELSIDLVLTGPEIIVNLAANVDGDRSVTAMTLKVEPPSKLKEIWYRFLEPHGQFDGEPEIHEVDSTRLGDTRGVHRREERRNSLAASHIPGWILSRPQGAPDQGGRGSCRRIDSSRLAAKRSSLQPSNRTLPCRRCFTLPSTP